MMTGKRGIIELLEAGHVEYEIFEHEAVRTVEEADRLGLPCGEAATKNFFLRDRKKKNYFIITTRENKKVDLRNIRETLGTSALSFASEEDLGSMLGLVPGSVSPLGALNDRENIVKVFIDECFEGRLMDAHPNENTATLLMKADDMISLLRERGISADYIKI